MKGDQEYTPKYWVGHNKTKQDIFINTASKSFSDAVTSMVILFGEDYYDNEDLEVVLVEIKLIEG